MSQEQKLLPCKKCGLSDGALCYQSFARYWVRCMSCEFTTFEEPTEDKAIKEWNTRAAQPQAACTGCNDAGDFHDATGEWRGYCSCDAGVELRRKEPQAVEGLPEPVAYVHPAYLKRDALGFDCSRGRLAEAQVPLYTGDQVNAMVAKIAELERKEDGQRARVGRAHEAMEKLHARIKELEAQLARGKEGLPGPKDPTSYWDVPCGVSRAEEWNAAIDACAPILAARDAEIERLRMQLAACGVVAMANTPESAATQRSMHPDYMSASCQEVMRAVDREMLLRADKAELLDLLDRAQGYPIPADLYRDIDAIRVKHGGQS